MKKKAETQKLTMTKEPGEGMHVDISMNVEHISFCIATLLIELEKRTEVSQEKWAESIIKTNRAMDK